MDSQLLLLAPVHLLPHYRLHRAVLWEQMCQYGPNVSQPALYRRLRRPSHSGAPYTNGNDYPAAAKEKAGRYWHVDAGRCVSVQCRQRRNVRTNECRVCAISITRVIATYAIAEEYIKHPNDVICASSLEPTTARPHLRLTYPVLDYTAPVFFWTNIELSLAIVCACLPTLRPIYLHFFPKPTTTSSYGYGYGSTGPSGTKKSALGPKFRSKPYTEIEDFELRSHDESRRPDVEGGIVKEVTIHQISDDSSTANLRG